MNKYGIRSTNEIQNYTSDNIFIKTSENAHARNTLIFYKVEDQARGTPRSPAPLREPDMLAELVALRIKPTNYILSNMSLQKEKDGKLDIVHAHLDPNERLRHLSLNNEAALLKRKKLCALSPCPEDAGYSKDLLDLNLFKTNEDDADAPGKRLASQQRRADRVAPSSRDRSNDNKSNQLHRGSQLDKRSRQVANEFASTHNAKQAQQSKVSSGMVGKEETSSLSKR